MLYDSAEEQACRLLDALAGGDLTVEPNEPWSGRQGLMFSVESHATRHGRLALELELRQDHATNPTFRAAFVPRLLQAMARLANP